MEHILQFGINIDDETIKKTVMEKAEEEIIYALKQDVKRALFEPQRYSYRNDYTYEPTTYLNGKITDFLAENKDEILERVSDKLADRLSRTKKARELLGDVIKDLE